jgi:transketolase
VGRENYPVTWLENATYPWGKAQVTQTGDDVVLIGCGTLFSKAVEAGKLLAAKGVKATVINNPFVNRVDLDTIAPLVQKCGKLVTIEDHQIVCGMGSQISHALSTAGIAHVATTLGIDDEFGQSAYVAEHLYELHGLTGPKMAEAALKLLGK